MKGTLLITGANGFIGSFLCKYFLAHGYTCRALVRSAGDAPRGCETIIGRLEGSICKSETYHDVSAVIHCAALVHQRGKKQQEDTQRFMYVNKELTEMIARSAIAAGVKMFIFMSTIKVLGDHAAGEKVYTEDDRPAPTDPYGQSKYSAEEALRSLFSNTSNCKCAILRLPMVYGPGNKGNMLLLLKAARMGIRLPLGNATGKRSMIYVGNICSAIEALLTMGKSNTQSWNCYYLTDASDKTSAQLYNAVFFAMNGKTGVFTLPDFAIAMSRILMPFGRSISARLFDGYRFSSEKIRRHLGWSPPISFEEGITETVAWFKKECMKR